MSRPRLGSRTAQDRSGHADAIELGSQEHYRDAALYDHEYRRRRADVRFYRDLAARVLDSSGTILDLGCGTGRVTIPLARDGYQVVALDQSTAMRGQLEARRARLPSAVRDRIDIRAGDLRSFSLKQRFPLIIAAFNVIEHLYTRVELAACLAAVKHHLAPGGCFAFDVQVPDLGWLIRDPSKRWARTRVTHPTSGRRFWYSTNHDYDPVSQIAMIRIYYTPLDAGPEEVVLLSQRKYFPAELEALVAFSGLRMVERTDFQGAPISVMSESQVLLCTPMTPPKPLKTRVSSRTEK